jgi:hypothetical protein
VFVLCSRRSTQFVFVLCSRCSTQFVCVFTLFDAVCLCVHVVRRSMLLCSRRSTQFVGLFPSFDAVCVCVLATLFDAVVPSLLLSLC